MRNWWLAAIAGYQGNVPSDIPEGLAGAEGAGEIGRPGCGARGLRHSWAAGPGPIHDVRQEGGRAALVGGVAGQRAEAPIEARGVDGSRAAH